MLWDDVGFGGVGVFFFGGGWWILRVGLLGLGSVGFGFRAWGLEIQPWGFRAFGFMDQVFGVKVKAFMPILFCKEDAGPCCSSTRTHKTSNAQGGVQGLGFRDNTDYTGLNNYQPC